MSRSRPCILAAILLLTSTLAACSEAASPTQPRRIAPPTSAQLDDDTDPGTCRAGWNSSAGRCN